MKARDNPFATEHVHRLRFKPQGIDWPAMERRLDELGRWGAIVGPEGSGKTTLLYQLAAQWTREGWRVRRAQFHRHERPVFPAEFLDDLGHDVALLVDGAEQLSWWAWRRFVRAAREAGSLIVTSHRPGRLPTWITCRTSVELLDELVAELVVPCDEAVRVRNRELYQAHHGNLRDVLRAWYDLWAAADPVAARLRHRDHSNSA